MEFKEIFDFETLNVLELVNQLTREEEAVPLEELSVNLKVDKKTIIRYLKKLEKLFEKYHLDKQLSISCDSKRQFCLIKQSELALESFFVQFAIHIPELFFLNQVIKNKQIEMQKLAEKLLISESNLRRRIKKMNDWLKQSNLQFKHGTYELLGEEEQIRLLIYQYYRFVYRGTTRPFLLSERTKIDLFAKFIISFFELQINEIQKERLIKIIEITFFRYQSGNKIKIRHHWKQYVSKNPYFLNYLKGLSESELTDFLNLNEQIYLYLLVQSIFLPYFHRNIQSYIIQEHYEKRTNCYRSTLIVANTFKKIFFEKKFTFSKETIVSLIGFHLYYELFSYVDWVESGYKKESLEQMYPKFIGKLKQCISELIKGESIQKRIPINSLINRYFTILSSVLSPVYNEKKIVICLMTELSIEQEIELGKKIIRFFHKKYNLVVTYARTTMSILYADIILTTVIYQPIGEKHIEKILMINDNQPTVYLDKIENRINKLNQTSIVENYATIDG